jgi:predicted  nucleic acid-binding Zn-ribbon protein
MSITIETDLKEILDKLDQKMDRQFAQLDQKMDRQFAQLDQKMDRLDQKIERTQEDIVKLQVGQAKIEGDIKALDNKGSVIQPIITGITVAFVGGGLLALYKYLP